MADRLAIVMAAGKGTRMNSELPKVLHEVCGRPMIEYVIDALRAAGVNDIVVVVGFEAQQVRDTLAHHGDLRFVDQTEQLGTGHAVMMAREAIDAHTGSVIVLTGDSPLVQSASLQELLTKFESEGLACLLGTLIHENPTGLGRIVRDEDGVFAGIVEHKDATPEQQKIAEVNMSTYVFDAKALAGALDQLSDDNSQKEYYVTDCPGILKSEGRKVDALPVLKPCESLSINTTEDLQAVEAELKRIQG